MNASEAKMVSIRCPICGSDVDRVSWSYRTWKIVRCVQCDLEFATPFQAGDVSYYSEHQTYKELRKEVEMGRIPPGNLAIAHEIDRAIELHLGKRHGSIRVLDYGCGSGFYAGHLAKRGCEVVGVDFNPEMARIAKDLFGVESMTKTPGELLEEGRQFDLIVLNQVLEHVSTPLELMGQLGKLLSDGGQLFISVPNRDFIRASRKLKAGQLPEANYPPHHISFWSVRALSCALARAGLRVVRCSAQTYPEPIQTERSLSDRFGNLSVLPRVAAVIASGAGTLLRLPGVNLFAVAARS